MLTPGSAFHCAPASVHLPRSYVPDSTSRIAHSFSCICRLIVSNTPLVLGNRKQGEIQRLELLAQRRCSTGQAHLSAQATHNAGVIASYAMDAAPRQLPMYRFAASLLTHVQGASTDWNGNENRRASYHFWRNRFYWNPFCATFIGRKPCRTNYVGGHSSAAR